jgi:hypothetical protein
MMMKDSKIVVGKMRNFISPYYDPRMTEIPKGLFLHLFKHSGASLPFRNRGGDFEAFNWDGRRVSVGLFSLSSSSSLIA